MLFSKKKRIGEIYEAIASECLRVWNGLDDEQVAAFLKDKSFKEIEATVGAEPSIVAGINGIHLGINQRIGKLSQHLPDPDAYLDYQMYRVVPKELKLPGNEFLEYVLKGKALSSDARRRLNSIKYVLSCCSDETRAEITLKALYVIHDKWVRDNEAKFFDPTRQHKQYMFMPSLLIGWDETVKDLIFVRPILKELGLPDDIEAFYTKKVEIAKEKLELEKTLRDEIAKGDEFYPAMGERISEFLKNTPDACVRISKQVLSRL